MHSHPASFNSNAIVLLGLVSVIWGAAFPLTNIVVNGGMSSITVATFRILLAAIVLLALSAVAGSGLAHLTIANLRRLVPVALLSLAIPHTLMTWSQHYISSSHAVIIMSTVPLMTALLVSFSSRSECQAAPAQPPGFFDNAIKLAPGFLGVVILVGGAAAEGGRGELIGSVAAILASVSCAKGIMIMSQLSYVHPLSAGSSISIIALLFMLPVFFVTGHEVGAVPSTNVVLAILFLGVICTGLSSVLYVKLTSSFGAVFSSLSFYICPIFGLFLSSILVGDELSVSYVVSVSLVILSIFMIYRSDVRGFSSSFDLFLSFFSNFRKNKI